MSASWGIQIGRTINNPQHSTGQEPVLWCVCPIVPRNQEWKVTDGDTYSMHLPFSYYVNCHLAELRYSETHLKWIHSLNKPLSHGLLYLTLCSRDISWMKHSPCPGGDCRLVGFSWLVCLFSWVQTSTPPMVAHTTCIFHQIIGDLSKEGLSIQQPIEWKHFLTFRCHGLQILPQGPLAAAPTYCSSPQSPSYSGVCSTNNSCILIVILLFREVLQRPSQFHFSPFLQRG